MLDLNRETMKYIILLVLFVSCKENKDVYEHSNTVIIGEDTISFYNGWIYNRQVHGWHNGNGHADTINKVFYDTIRLELAHDTIYIHDAVSPTIYNSDGILSEVKIKSGSTIHPPLILKKTQNDSLIKSKWVDATQATRDTLVITPSIQQFVSHSQDTSSQWVWSVKSAVPSGGAKFNKYTIKALEGNVFFERPSGAWEDGNQLLVDITFKRFTENQTSFNYTIDWDESYLASADLPLIKDHPPYKRVKMSFLYSDGKWNLITYFGCINENCKL